MVKYWLLISLILIHIVGQASLDDQSTICQISIRRDTHTDTADRPTRRESGPVPGIPSWKRSLFRYKMYKVHVKKMHVISYIVKNE